MNFQRHSKISFFSVVGLLPICFFAVVYGIAETGGGHGEYWLFYAAVGLSVCTGLLLLYSVLTGFVAARNNLGEVPWLLLAVPLLLAALALAVWGLRG